ncbi:uncharacterized protein LOC109845499 isoform X2 [Asparagus officinalis]|uniref:uncharacterized protein LOC109845499 isoform X2 n=1 Tax=Asparagus officinalis TaxID=4686 RepID=UPI00098E20C3|nr:uncharacterized protein LOC109845499 isoform X2 [Asparagus officinalis]
MPGDFIVINFFALEGWSLAELYQVQCVVAAPYVLPYRVLTFSVACVAHLHHLNANSDMNFHFCSSTFKKRLLKRSAGKMFNIGCGHSFQKIGAHGEVIV